MKGKLVEVSLKGTACFSKGLEQLYVAPHLQEHHFCALCLSCHSSYKALFSLQLYHTVEKPSWEHRKTELEKRENSLSLVRRLTQSYLKYHNPGIPDVVKVDGTLVRVSIACTAHVVVLVPVDTHATDVELLPD